jgi:hypothetical protein
VVLHWLAEALLASTRKETIVNRLREINESVGGEQLEGHTLLNTPFWKITEGHDVGEDVLDGDKLDMAGTFTEKDYQKAVMMYALREVIDISVSDENGNIIPLNHMTEIVKVFGEEAKVFAEQHGFWHPMRVCKTAEKDTAPMSMFF